MMHRRVNENVHAHYNKLLHVRQQQQTPAAKPAPTINKAAAPSKSSAATAKSPTNTKGHASSKTAHTAASASASAANTSGKKGGISGAAIGAIVGVIALLILLAAAAFWRRRLSQKRRERRRVSIRVEGETLNADSYAPAPDNLKSASTEKVSLDTPRSNTPSTQALERDLPAVIAMPALPPMAAFSTAPQSSSRPSESDPFMPAPPYEVISGDASAHAIAAQTPHEPAAPAPARQYATVKRAFIPSLPDELHITLGEVIEIVQQFDDGWCLCANARGDQGVAPLECLNKTVVAHIATNGEEGNWQDSRRESSLYT